MIRKNVNFHNSKKVTVAEFGNGDISVGTATNFTDKEVYLTFYNLSEPIKIGEIINDKNKFHDINYDIIFTFNKVESIDVVIERLNLMKASFINLNIL